MLEIAKHFGIFRGTTKLWDVRSQNAPLFPDLYSFDEGVGVEGSFRKKKVILTLTVTVMTIQTSN